MPFNVIHFNLKRLHIKFSQYKTFLSTCLFTFEQLEFVDGDGLLSCCLVMVGFDCLGNNQKLRLTGFELFQRGLQGVFLLFQYWVQYPVNLLVARVALLLV